MKDRKKIIIYFLVGFVVSAGLLLITESWLMSMGILIILVICDILIREYVARKQQENDDDK